MIRFVDWRVDKVKIKRIIDMTEIIDARILIGRKKINGEQMIVTSS